MTVGRQLERRRQTGELTDPPIFRDAIGTPGLDHRMEYFDPKTRPHSIFLDEEAKEGAEETEPLYGFTYLPRKFKIGIGTPADNRSSVC